MCLSESQTCYIWLKGQIWPTGHSLPMSTLSNVLIMLLVYSVMKIKKRRTYFYSTSIVSSRCTNSWALHIRCMSIITGRSGKHYSVEVWIDSDSNSDQVVIKWFYFPLPSCLLTKHWLLEIYWFFSLNVSLTCFPKHKDLSSDM